MTEHLVTPDQTIEIAGQNYTLDGGFKTLKDIQHAMGDEILNFLRTKLPRLGFDDMAKIIRIGITNAKGTPPSAEMIEQAIVDEIGIANVRETLFLWLAVATCPKGEREKKAQELAEILKKRA